ncbi:HAMP domain-containing protein [Streptomyces bobili]|uniref:HAMP domain-containing protein n=1 Tax=Streptomyces bobili TaxID=67280 RepID=UPI0033A96502
MTGPVLPEHRARRRPPALAGAVPTVRHADDEAVSGGSGTASGSEDEHGMPGSERGHHRQGMGSGPSASTSVVVDGSSVGSVNLVFSAGSGSAGLSVAWGWVAAVGAVALALAVAWFATRRLTAPIVRVAAAARAVAAGDRTARAGIEAPGEPGDLARAKIMTCSRP